jgi:hypothetical protein
VTGKSMTDEPLIRDETKGWPTGGAQGM